MIKNKNDVIILAAGNSQRFRDKQKSRIKKYPINLWWISQYDTLLTAKR
ncbi:MAG: hypothetical protein CM15mP63_0630 [Gammaproteobacteria bacterium]|nr:MAG: hypothetical protein CM15mP63_0630 [Gammaproteobacteria bacterium]